VTPKKYFFLLNFRQQCDKFHDFCQCVDVRKLGPVLSEGKNRTEKEVWD